MKKIGVVICFVIVGLGFALIGLALSRSLASVNEPDPRTYDARHIVSLLSTQGVDVEVDKVLYIYSDVTTFIFEGKVKNIDQSSWTGVPHGGLWHRNPHGMVVVGGSKNGATLVGFSDQRFEGPAEPHFKKHWDEIMNSPPR